MDSVANHQSGGVGRLSILHVQPHFLDPWVLSAVGSLTQAAIDSGFWDPSNLDNSYDPPLPHKEHPLWEIVLDKRYDLTDDEAIWTRPIWMVAEDGLPCVRWVSNLPLAFCCNHITAPSSRIPSDIGSIEEERRGRGQTPRSQPATAVTHAKEKHEEQVKVQADKDVDSDKSEGKSVTGSEGKGEGIEA